MEASQTPNQSLSTGRQHEKSRVLTKAFLNAGELMGLTNKELAAIVGVSAPTISRMTAPASYIDPATKHGELAMLLIRLFRSLDAIVGGSHEASKAWLDADNTYFDAPPRSLLSSATGLIRVVEYLDAMRAKNLNDALGVIVF